MRAAPLATFLDRFPDEVPASIISSVFDGLMAKKR
jgi:hypothetical protein